MRVFGLGLVISGMGAAAAFLIVGGLWSPPWSTTSAVLFGLGLAYAGICGWRREEIVVSSPAKSASSAAELSQGGRRGNRNSAEKGVLASSL